MPANCNKTIIETTGIPMAHINPKTPKVIAAIIGSVNGLTSFNNLKTTPKLLNSFFMNNTPPILFVNLTSYNNDLFDSLILDVFLVQLMNHPS